MKYQLCYISPDRTAYFSTLPVKEMWGDDWDDAPYEHNAGPPYNPNPPDFIMAIKFDIPTVFLMPLDVNYYSVKNINKRVPWLSVDSDDVFAGASIGEFIDLIFRHGGVVYFAWGSHDFRA